MQHDSHMWVLERCITEIESILAFDRPSIRSLHSAPQSSLLAALREGD